MSWRNWIADHFKIKSNTVLSQQKTVTNVDKVGLHRWLLLPTNTGANQLVSLEVLYHLTCSSQKVHSEFSSL